MQIVADTGNHRLSRDQTSRSSRCAPSYSYHQTSESFHQPMLRSRPSQTPKTHHMQRNHHRRRAYIDRCRDLIRHLNSRKTEAFHQTENF
ncbi:hypothetical protein DY000_02010766 [Brassica cretica]|uniref:BHLH domain-containing protein n=1 Tax=Brassica cretica TaxID=69181 RepID=A0ABQ7CL17_BRACR|nr:hypothetical protein DY000_02010766 [Brassica cretica]